MATIITPEQAKPIPDFSPGSFNGDSLLFQVNNGNDTRVDGDQVANYVVTQKTYSQLDGKTIPQAFQGVAQDIDSVEQSVGGLEQAVDDLEQAVEDITLTKDTATLTAGATTLRIQNAAIHTTSDILVFPHPFIKVEDMAQTEGEVEITFQAQANNVTVNIWIG